jgi:hypothetical protein
MTERWDPQKRVLAGLGAMVVVELLEQAFGLRRRARRAVALRLYEFDRSTRHGMHRAEVSMFIAGLSGARHPHR